MNKGLVAIALIVVLSLVIATLALSEIYPITTQQPTAIPKATPTSTPNLSSAIPDTTNYVSVNVTAQNTAHFPHQWMPIYYVNLTNNGASPLTIVSINCTAIDDQTNFTYWSGNQDIIPNTTENFSANSTYFAEWPMNAIYVYYEVSGQLFIHTLAPVPLPTYPPTP